MTSAVRTGWSALAACTLLAVGASLAQAWHPEPVRYQGPGDIFYDHYVGPGTSGVVAAMNPVPIPTPPHVGHTYLTYPPLYPHEMMYRHHRTWFTYHPGAGWTRTKARYGTRGTLWDLISGAYRH